MKNVIVITDVGAVADGKELQTEAIQYAIDQCFGMGGGEVVIPKGIFLTGGIRLRSNVTLRLQSGAVLKGSRNPEDYFGYLKDETEPLSSEQVTDVLWHRAEQGTGKRDYRFLRVAGSRWNNALIRAIGAHNIAIIGEEGSRIDGSNCFDELGEEHYRGPHCINLFHCRNVTLEGYSIRDSANWAHAIFYSENIVLQNVTVEAGHDGAHFTCCSNIGISDCQFYTGDDCVAGFSNINVSVRRCVLNSACSAFRFGGTNVVVEQCRVYAPCKYLFRGCLTKEEKRDGAMPSLEGRRTNMLSVFTYYADFSVPIDCQPGNIVIRDCQIEGADRFLHYNFSGNERWQANRPLESIRFENIRATGIAMPLTAYGSKEVLLTLEMKNIDLSLREGSEAIDWMHVANYRQIRLENVTLSNFCGKALIKTWSDEGTIELKNICTEHLESKDYVQKATEEFVCKAI